MDTDLQTYGNDKDGIVPPWGKGGTIQLIMQDTYPYGRKFNWIASYFIIVPKHKSQFQIGLRFKCKRQKLYQF